MFFGITDRLSKAYQSIRDYSIIRNHCKEIFMDFCARFITYKNQLYLCTENNTSETVVIFCTEEIYECELTFM